jgi:hypothetical protein
MNTDAMTEGQWYDVGIGAAAPARAAWRQDGNTFHAWAKVTIPGTNNPIMIHASTDLAAIERGLLDYSQGQPGAAEAGRFGRRFKKFGRRVKKFAKKTGITKVVKGVVKVAKKAINNPLVQAALASNPFGQAFLMAQKGAKLVRAARRGVKGARRAVRAIRKRYRRGDRKAAQALRFMRSGLRSQRRMGPMTRAALSGDGATAADMIFQISGIDDHELEGIGDHELEGAESGYYEIMGDDYVCAAGDAEGQEFEALWSASGDLPFAGARAALVEIDGDMAAGRPWQDRMQRATAEEEGAGMDPVMSTGEVRQLVLAGADPLDFAEVGRGRWRRRFKKRLKKLAKHAFDPRQHLKHIKRGMKIAKKFKKMVPISSFMGADGYTSGDGAGYVVGIGDDGYGYGLGSDDLGEILTLPQVQGMVVAGADPLDFAEVGRGRWRRRLRKRLRKIAKHAFDPRQHLKHIKRGVKMARKISKVVPISSFMGEDDSARSLLERGRYALAARALA